MNVGANASSIGKLYKSNHDLDASKNVKCGRTKDACRNFSIQKTCQELLMCEM
jgi:hypothetical protein